MTEKEQDTPFGILIISMYYILVATYFFAVSSYYGSPSYYAMLPLMGLIFIGIFYMLLGWGILAFKKWAYYTVIITTIVSLILFGFTLRIIDLFVSFILLMVNIIIQVGIVTYIVPRSELFGIIPLYKKYQPTLQPNALIRICPDCKRNIPFDALICPYCGKKFKTYF